MMQTRSKSTLQSSPIHEDFFDGIHYLVRTITVQTTPTVGISAFENRDIHRDCSVNQGFAPRLLASSNFECDILV